jgi:hypothetical protein
LPSIAKCELESASQRNPVRGDLPTTANFAEVVSGVPTNGEKQNTSDDSGARGSTPGEDSRKRIQAPSPTPPM